LLQLGPATPPNHLTDVQFKCQKQKKTHRQEITIQKTVSGYYIIYCKCTTSSWKKRKKN